jgi:AraC-like DNA-binding protein
MCRIMHDLTPVSAPRLPTTRFSTASLPPEQQFDAYAAASGTVFSVDRSGPARPQGFRGELSGWAFGDLVLRRTASAGPVRSTRHAEAIRRDQMDHWAITAWRQGTNRGEVAGQGFDMQRGHVYLYGLHAPGHWERDEADWNMLFIPRDALPDLAGAFDAGIGRSAQLPLAPLLWSHIDQLDRALDLADAAQGAELAAATRALLRAMLGGREAREAARPVLSETMRRRVLGLIRANLGSARLSPARLAALAGLSRTRIYALFEADGGVARAIQRERLRVIRQALADPFERRPIAALAEAYGMPDPSVFSRAFRREMGVTPGDYRAMARLGPVPEPRREAAPDGLSALLRTLDQPRAA